MAPSANQSAERGLEVFGGVFIELRERDVRDLAVQHDRKRNRRHVNDCAREAVLDRVGTPAREKFTETLVFGVPEE